MIEPTPSQYETSRLESLRSLGLLDTAPEERFDRITRMAKRLFGVPIVLISLVDANRQWFKSCIGLQASETPRNISFCAHAILGDEALVIPDALLDERFHDNPLVTDDPWLRFYAGQPLILPDGSRLGTLCLISPEPRNLDEEDLQLLCDLGKMVEAELGTLNQAMSCDVTGLANRRGFFALGRQALVQCRRGNSPATIVVLDVEGFKSINDRLGPGEGNRALKDFGALLRNTFRSSDIISRIGDVEFAVLLSNCNEDQSQSALARLQQATSRRNRTHAQGYDIAFTAASLACDASQDVSLEMLLNSVGELMNMNKRIRQIGSAPQVGSPELNR